MIEAFDKYPPKTWTYEVLQKLRGGCSLQKLREAEQKHIVLLRTLDPEYGFNIHPALPSSGVVNAPYSLLRERTFAHTGEYASRGVK